MTTAVLENGKLKKKFAFFFQLLNLKEDKNSHPALEKNVTTIVRKNFFETLRQYNKHLKKL